MRTVLRSAFALLIAVVLVGCGSNSPAPSNNPLQNRLAADVSGNGAYTHLEALQRIADSNGGNRATPSPGYDASVDYVAGLLRKAGYQVSTPTFEVRDTTVRNVIAQTRTGNPEHVVMAGAHLDSVEEGPGINDNGSGSAALLEIALKMGSSPPVSNAVRFAWWGAEEKGLRGSKSYVEDLSERERDRIAMYLNLDMVASPNAGYLVLGGKGFRSSTSGPEGSGTVAQVVVNQLAITGVTAENIEFEKGDSDYAPFIKAGIPGAGARTGDDGIKTAEQAKSWGGQAGEVFDRCYHKACDRLDNINSTALDRYTHAVAGTLGYFAMSTASIAR